MKVEAKIIPANQRMWIVVESFPIYDDNDRHDPLIARRDALLASNPTYIKSHYSIKDSDWGWDVLRPETDEEYNKRREQEKAQIKKQNGLIKNS